MNAVLRYIILIPLGLLLGISAAMLALLLLTIFIPDLAQTIGVAAFAAFNAVFDALTRDDPATAAAVGWKAWQLLLMIIVMPIVLTALIGEFFRISGLAHGIISGIIAAAVPLAARLSASSAESRVLACLYFAGFAGGLVYFAVGGRRDIAQAQQELPPR